MYGHINNDLGRDKNRNELKNKLNNDKIIEVAN